MSVLERMRYTMSIAREAWESYDRPATPQSREDHYQLLWRLDDGTAFAGMWQRRGIFRDVRVYRNTRLVWKHVRAVNDFYAAKTYMGALPGAIPLLPATGDETDNAAIIAGVEELWRRWNWHQGMRHRPRYASTLGDCLTELIDDPARHAVWPQLVWPGYVADVTLDRVENVKAYAVEYRVTQERNGREETFRYRKEVDGHAFRFYRDDQPWSDADGHGEWEQENPYGFVPAIWDRFRQIPNSERGEAAVASTLHALLEMNSVLSHSLDYQRKAFAAPVLIKGSAGRSSKPVIGPERTTDPAKLAETMNMLEVGADAGIEQVQFDIGKTLEQLEFVKQGILDENPEASFYHELRKMSSLTGPAVRLAMGDVVTRVEDARAAMDPQTVKLHQMALAMAGYRLNRGDWVGDDARDAVFRPFDLDSYRAGKLNLSIEGDRDVIPDSEEDRIRVALLREQLRYADSFVDVFGMEEADAAALVKAREEAELRRIDIV